MSSFHSIKSAIQKKVTEFTKDGTKIFLTDVDKDKMWEIYLESFPAGTNEIYKERTEHDCNCCKNFIRQFGNVVAVVNGNIESIWDLVDVEYPYDVVAGKLSEYVKSASIKNLFIAESAKIGTDKNVQLLEEPDTLGNKTKTWEHFHVKLPSSYVNRGSKSIPDNMGTYRSNKETFKRALDELSLDAAETIVTLSNMEEGALYKGKEFLPAIKAFINTKVEYDEIEDSLDSELPEDEFKALLKSKQDNWCWLNSFNNPVAKLRNSAIGSLLINLSDGEDMVVAVKKYEAVVAPRNYKRSKSLVTPKMVENANKTVIELGYENSLERRYARKDDITINNVIFADGRVKSDMKKSPLMELAEDVSTVSAKKFDHLNEVNIKDFIKDVVPFSKSIEVLVENKHTSNLMSLVAPNNIGSKSMLKWNNNFSWAYNGDITDSMKERVKAAGGKVDGVLRFSIQWNDDGDNSIDFDAHAYEPDGTKIAYNTYRGHKTKSSGMLDVDIKSPGSKIAVENITWTNFEKMQNGEYKFIVHNFDGHLSNGGFTAEIEYEGELHTFSYDKNLRGGEHITVATVKLDKKTGIIVDAKIDSGTSIKSKEVWGVNTSKFVNVDMMMLSPNYWDEQTETGHKHYFFILEGCKAEENPRGFFNEFLSGDLHEHRKVFEVLGSKMKVESSDEQLSGIGFSETQENSIVVKVDGDSKKTFKVNFNK